MSLIREFKDLRVYQLSFSAAMRIFELTDHWPKAERYSLTDQIRRSSRSVCSNIAEGWEKRLYVPSFVSKLSDSKAEAAETLVWLDFALACRYIDETGAAELAQTYRQIIGGLTKMIVEPEPWCGPAKLRESDADYNFAAPNPCDDLKNP